MRDPSVPFKEHIKSLSFSKGNRGTSTRKPVVNENTGKSGGYHVEHWDDSQDAHVIPDTMELRVTRKEE